MHRNSRSIRAALVGTTTALCLASSLVVAACGFRVAAPDFPVLKLTDSVEPTASVEPSVDSSAPPAE
jgi:hypothetical protein